MSYPIFTDKALVKMAGYHLSESQVFNAFSNGRVEKWSNGNGSNAIGEYHGYEIGVAYSVDSKGVTRITSVWKRARR